MDDRALRPGRCGAHFGRERGRDSNPRSRAHEAREDNRSSTARGLAGRIRTCDLRRPRPAGLPGLPYSQTWLLVTRRAENAASTCGRRGNLPSPDAFVTSNSTDVPRRVLLCRVESQLERRCSSYSPALQPWISTRVGRARPSWRGFGARCSPGSLVKQHAAAETRVKQVTR
jgi:hypothetical protein